MTHVLCLLQVLLEVVACTVVFQFVPEGSNGDACGRVPSYYDKLNSWVRLGRLFSVYTMVWCLQHWHSISQIHVFHSL